MFLSCIKMGVNIVCTLLLPGKHPWSISEGLDGGSGIHYSLKI